MERAKTLTRKFEGLRLKAYRCPAGKWTIGYGHTKGVAANMTCTEAEAEKWLEDDLVEARDGAAKYIPGTPLTSAQAAALIDFVFNVGVGKFSRSTMCRHLRMGNAHAAGEEFAKWVFAGGVKLPGLVTRRQEEAYLYSQKEI